MWRLRENSPAAYLAAIGIAVMAVLLRLWMSGYVNGVPFIAFFPAIVLSAYVGGRRAGLATVLLCGIAAWYFLIPPYRSFRIETPQQLIPLVAYFVTSGVIALAVSRMRSAIEQASNARSDLAASEAQFRSLADSSPALIWITDENAQVTFANRRYEEVFGRAPAEIEGDGWRGIMHPDDVDAFNARFLAAHTARERFYGDVRVYDRNGDLMWLHCEGIPRFSGDGRFLGYVGANLDVTEGKLAQQRLGDLNAMLEGQVVEANAERQVFADIVESTPAAIMALDAGYTILAANRAALSAIRTMFGKQPKVGDNLRQLFSDTPEHVAMIEASWGRALAGENFVIVEEFGDAGHERRAYEARFSVLRDRDGRVIGAAHTAFDVSERIRSQHELGQAQDALRQSQKMESIGQLTGGVAHDFNNLLTPIVGVLDMLRRRGDIGDQHQRLVEGALQSAERARILVQRLLAFARRQPLQPAPVDMAALIEGMAELVIRTSGPQVQVILDVQPDLPAVLADANQLEMAILNLAVNARDAMPDGGRLTISATVTSAAVDSRPDMTPGDYVLLAMTDTGVGMDAATLARAVEPFFSTKAVGEGTGLGLSMVHGLALQLGGALMIRSEPGVGTTMELWLPVSASTPPVETGKTSETLAPAAGTVLLVDDEDLVRMTTTDMLLELGYTVVEARSAEEALTQIEHGLQFDLLVTDHLMPGMRGAELAATVRARCPQKPVILVSGYADIEGVPPTLPRLAKPFRQAELASALESLGHRDRHAPASPRR